MDGQATKNDQNKPRCDLLPPVGLLLAARVMGYGAAKYGAHNYLRGGMTSERLIAAGMRHLLAWLSGEIDDPESGQPHLAHASASILMATEVCALKPAQWIPPRDREGEKVDE